MSITVTGFGAILLSIGFMYAGVLFFVESVKFIILIVLKVKCFINKKLIMRRMKKKNENIIKE